MLTYPEGAAGTRLADGTILSGDDADIFRTAGFATYRVHVGCSAEVAAGRQTVREPLALCAIDCNGASADTVRRIVGGRHDHVRPAQGIYDGAVAPAIIVRMHERDILAAHYALLRELPGFGCFAILTAADADALTD